MATVARFPRGAQLDMSTAKEQVRASIILTHAHAIAERLLQVDKCNPAFRLADLRDDNERGIYIDAAASFLLDAAGRLERTEALNQTRAYVHAIHEDEQQTIDARARQDVAIFGHPLLAKFMRTSPNFCAVCGDVLMTNAVDVLLTDSLKGRAHGLCCAKDEEHFAFVNEFTYRLLGVK